MRSFLAIRSSIGAPILLSMGVLILLLIGTQWAAPALAQQAAPESGATQNSAAETAPVIPRTAPPEPKSLDELLEGVTEKNLHAEVDAGAPRGGEAW